jgi:flagellar biosynthesis/type III secretory pathway protein FliH
VWEERSQEGLQEAYEEVELEGFQEAYEEVELEGFWVFERTSILPLVKQPRALQQSEQLSQQLGSMSVAQAENTLWT